MATKVHSKPSTVFLIPRCGWLLADANVKTIEVSYGLLAVWITRPDDGLKGLKPARGIICHQSEGITGISPKQGSLAYKGGSKELHTVKIIPRNPRIGG